MEEKHPFLKTIVQVEERIKKMQGQLAASRWFFENGNREEAYRRALLLEDTSERCMLLTRLLPTNTGNPKALDEVTKITQAVFPVDMGFTIEGWFCLRIPALLPRKERGSTAYLRDRLYPAMQEFFGDKPMVRYRNCVLVYRHIYSSDRPERRKRDHDNIEVNFVSDAVALYVMPDDGPEICRHYYCSTEGLSDRTEVYVVPTGDFPTWLSQEPSIPPEGIKLYETRCSPS